MNYHNITKSDMLNGDGLRVVLWVAGCNHHCKGCQNPVTWDPDDGIPYDREAWNEIVEELRKDYVSGITFSGGDPLHPKNRDQIITIAAHIKKEFPDKTIWVYTGYSWEYCVEHIRGLEYFDVIVDGQFMEMFTDNSYPWAGSTNQRIIDVKKSLKAGCAIRHKTHESRLEGRKNENYCGCDA